MKHINNFKLNVISLIIAFILFYNFDVLAQKMNYSEVEKVALNAYSLNTNQKSSNFTIKEIISITDNDEIAYYIFNFEPKGHIVVSNDKDFEPILGYGFNSTIDFENIPPGLKYLLDYFKIEIGYAKKIGISSNNETKEKWDYYLSINEQNASKSYSSGTYLLQTTWDQASGYQQFCPNMPNSSIKCSVGCGGVALGQILKYWNCRVFQDGSRSYTSPTINQTLSVNYFEQNYDWQNMALSSPDAKNALLLYHSAVALSSDFCHDGTSTSSTTHQARNALVNYFGFHADFPVFKNNFTNSTWSNMLKSQIDSYRPVYYRGEGSDGGHAWVIDGYNTSNDKFHCNWGWSGNYND